jgi:hypothetical protein
LAFSAPAFAQGVGAKPPSKNRKGRALKGKVEAAGGAAAKNTKGETKPADDSGDGQDEARKEAARKVRVMGSGAEVKALLARVSKLSFLEQNKGVKTSLKMMRKAARALSKQIQAARADRDIVKINCLNDKYLQIRAARKLTRKFYKKMLTAQKAVDHSTRNHEFAKIVILTEKVRIKIEESKNCDGKSSELLGTTEVSAEKTDDAAGAKDPSKATDVPQDPDPYTSIEITPAGPLFRPPLASPSA